MEKLFKDGEIFISIPTNEDDFVDLGLSVKWSKCNIGASRPEEFGDYFAWGETSGYKSGKTNFSWDTYSLCRGSKTSLTKYCLSSSEGIVDNKKTLEIEDDAAIVNLGGKWRMPTKEEIEELLSNCACKWTTLNGIKGCELTGKNGNTIFLPACGFIYNTSVDDVQITCDYLTSTLSTLSSIGAYTLSFYGNERGTVSDVQRCFGFSIRPIMK